MRSSHRRKANNALGVFLIALLSLSETVVAHHVRPSPLSPVIWASLGCLAVGALAAYAWYRARDRRSTT